MRGPLILFGAIIVLSGLATPADAAGKGMATKAWHLRAFGVWMDPSLGVTVLSDEGTDTRVSGSSDLDFGTAPEYQSDNRLGAELSVFSAGPGVQLSANIRGFGRLARRRFPVQRNTR